MQHCNKLCGRWHPNVIYAPCKCLASIKEMLPYSGKEAFGRVMGGIGMK
jgi:hypothetical protein